MNKKGFTLVELIAVIAIIGILATLASVAVFGVMRKSKEDVGEFTLKQIEDAAITYALDISCKDVCTLEGEEIIQKLSLYYPEISEKCTINSDAEVKISYINDDYEVEISGISCTSVTYTLAEYKAKAEKELNENQPQLGFRPSLADAYKACPKCTTLDKKNFPATDEGTYEDYRVYYNRNTKEYEIYRAFYNLTVKITKDGQTTTVTHRADDDTATETFAYQPDIHYEVTKNTCNNVSYNEEENEFVVYTSGRFDKDEECEIELSPRWYKGWITMDTSIGQVAGLKEYQKNWYEVDLEYNMPTGFDIILPDNYRISSFGCYSAKTSFTDDTITITANDGDAGDCFVEFERK